MRKFIKYTPHVIVAGLAASKLNDLINGTIGVRGMVYEDRKRQLMESNYAMNRDIKELLAKKGEI